MDIFHRFAWRPCDIFADKNILFNMKDITFILAAVLAVIVLGLYSLDSTRGIYVSNSDTAVKVNVTDVEGNAVIGATVTVVGQGSSVSGYGGFCSAIPLKYLSDKSPWFSVNIMVKAAGYLDTVLFYCVVYKNSTRTVQIRLLYDDGSLPYVVYSEIPPKEYIDDLFE